MEAKAMTSLPNDHMYMSHADRLDLGHLILLDRQGAVLCGGEYAVFARLFESEGLQRQSWQPQPQPPQRQPRQPPQRQIVIMTNLGGVACGNVNTETLFDFQSEGKCLKKNSMKLTVVPYCGISLPLTMIEKIRRLSGPWGRIGKSDIHELVCELVSAFVIGSVQNVQCVQRVQHMQKN
jgi:hypothetical protein